MFTFSFLHTAMVRPLPVPGGDRLVRVEQATGGTGGAIDAADLAIARNRALGSSGRSKALLSSRRDR